MEKEKLIRQLFIGKVSDIIGINKTYELLKEAKKDLEYINKPLSYQKEVLIKDCEKFFNKSSDSICEKTAETKECKNKPEIEMWKMLNQINIIMFENYMISKEQILKKEPAEKIMQILEQWAKNY